MKIGVYICECGINISNTVDVEKVAEYAKSLPSVVVSTHYKYMCSDPGQEMIKDDIKTVGLDKVVVASCSPRMHEPTFRTAIEEAGLNPYCLEMANIREQCSWVHKDKAEATAKAIKIVTGSVLKAAGLTPLEAQEAGVNKSALVVGGGIAGIQAALDIADTGYKVYLVEREPTIGGRMAQLDKTFPTLDCSACILTPKMADVPRHPNIELLTYSEVEEVSGYVGNFKAKVRKKARYIDADKCTGCGECTKVCPVEVVSEFNEGSALRKAIYIPFPQAVPQKYTIDKIGIPPCTNACPAGIQVQGYIALIGEGKFQEALDLIRENNPFPGICGRVCTHPCEDNCNRKDVDEPVAVNALKRFVSDWEMKNSDKGQAPKEEKSGEEKKSLAKVAIIGSGPGGLAAGYYLAKMGYRPTVFEALPVTGGMLRVGIPEYRLPDEILDYEIEKIKEQGVKIKTNTPVGPDLTFDDLRKKGYQAIFAAIGLHTSLKLGIKGENLKGVMHGIDFLSKTKKGESFDFRDKVVAVIGGGNVAMDSARSALRFSAKKVVVVYRRSRAEMPAIKEEIESAIREEIDFRFLTSPQKAIGNPQGEIKELECIEMKLGKPDKSGRRRPIPIPGSEFKIGVDILIVAVGQKSDYRPLKVAGKNLEIERGQIEVDPLTLETNIPGVFAGGDCIGGSGIAVQAIADGHKAAVSIDKYLRKADLREGRTKRELPIAPLPEKDIKKVHREKVPELLIKDRVDNFREVELGFNEEQAITEAKRCMNCNICSTCKQCAQACEAEAIDHEMSEEIIEFDVGAIIAATGFDLYDPSQKPEYGYGKYEGVITGLEFERLVSASGPTEGKILINGKEPRKVVFIQCVGSREQGGEREYCSRVCCMYTAKHAHLVKEKIKDAEINIFYTDVRSYGKGYEEFVNRVKDEGAQYLRRELDDPIEVTKNKQGLVVRAKGHPDLEADLVVLAAAIIPRKDALDLARKMNISQSPDGFYLEAHPKLRPVETLTEGVLLAGCCQGPKDIPDSVAQGSGAASRAMAILSKNKIKMEAITARADEDACRGCGLCVEVCPYGAIELKEVNKFGYLVQVASVNEVLCKGCGACSATCLSQAIQQKGFTDQQLLSAISGVISVP